jgi:hypothetical protein
MQENALHGWRLADKKNMAMRGYPAKVRSLSWAQRGRWLVTSGSDSAVMWPFRTEDGPMGKAPTMLGAGRALVTCVAAHPALPLVAIGFKDGLVLLARIDEQDSIPLRNADSDHISSHAWGQQGNVLALGTEGGRASLLNLG